MRRLCLALVCATAGCAMWQAPQPVRGGAPFHSIYVVRRGHHTDIALRTADTRGAFAQAASRFPGAAALLVGFGDRSFITTRHKWLGTWLMTLLPGHGAMLVTGLRVTPDRAFPAGDVVTLRADDAQAGARADYVASSFASEAGGHAVFIGNGPYPGSVFFASGRTYDLLETCNTWTDAALAHGGFAVRPALTLFAGQTMRQARAVSVAATARAAAPR